MRAFLSVGTRLMLVSVLTVGCSDDDDKTTAPDDTPAPITGAVTGVVQAGGGDLEDARVSADGLVTFTNQDGYFVLPDMDVGDVVIEVTHDGFAPSYRSTSVREDQTTHIPRVVLLDERITDMSADIGGLATSSNGVATVELAGGSLVTEAGDPYTGDVTVAMSASRPDDPDFFDAFPGSFEGRRPDGSVVPFESFGFSSIVLTEADTERPLRLGSGETAGVRMTVAPGLLRSAPESIPLWHFDEDEGVWIEEGAATLVGNAYEGDVTHFTIWNWDLPIEDICAVEGDVVNARGSAVNQARVFMQGLDVTFRDEALTDMLGHFSVRGLPSTMATVWTMKGITVSEPMTVTIGVDCPLMLELPLVLTQAPFTVSASWGFIPDDIDAHMFIPMNWMIDGESYDYYHISYYSEGAAGEDPYTFLDTDDTDSYGPEIITGLDTYDGTYEYWLQRYADEGSMVDSPTIVSVQTVSQYRSFDARQASGMETEYWHVFDMMVSGDNIQIVPVNRFENAGTNDEWENWHGGTDTFYPDTDPNARLNRQK
jgi:hypothetical protein